MISFFEEDDRNINWAFFLLICNKNVTFSVKLCKFAFQNKEPRTKNQDKRTKTKDPRSKTKDLRQMIKVNISKK